MTLQTTIEQAWDQRAELSPSSAPAAVREAVGHVIAELNAGRLRVAEKRAGDWVVHQWVKKAVLLSFRLEDNRPVESGDLRFYDKVPTKFEGLARRTSPPAATASCRRRSPAAAASTGATSC